MFSLAILCGQPDERAAKELLTKSKGLILIGQQNCEKRRPDSGVSIKPITGLVAHVEQQDYTGSS